MSATNQGDAVSRGYDWNEYSKRYRRNHPEKVKQWNINKAVNLLRRNGFTVTPPITTGDQAEEGAVNG